MKKCLFILISSFVFILLPVVAFATNVTPVGLQLFYTDDQGVSHSTSNTATQDWSGHTVVYITQGFDGGSFSSIPNVLYSHYGSYNCGENCSVTGSFMNYVPNGVTDLNNSVKVELEANGRYNTCRVDSVSVYNTFFEKIDFTCYSDSLTNGFNLVESNLAVYPDKVTYYGIAVYTVDVRENVNVSDIINNNTQNTQNIINNQNNNTQSIINNQNNNTQSIINNQNNNANQAHQDSEDIKNAITSDDIPTDNSSTASQWASNNASDSVVSDMVLMPITLLTAFSSGFNGTCQAYNLGSLYGTNLTLPCINIQNYLGSTLWTIIDVLMSGFLIYGIGKKFVKVFNDFTNLKDSQVDELYGGGSE